MFMKDKAWSPYVAGILLGLLQIPAVLIIGSTLGASSSFVGVGGWLASLFDGDLVQEHGYFEKYMTSLKYVWQASMVLSIAVGAYLSRRLSGADRKAVSPIWHRALGSTHPARRYALAFIGGFIMLFGARWAGGCTSGHGISGFAQLAVGSMIAIVFMFVGGMLVANLFRRI